MESIFLLQKEARATFLQTIGQALGCTYICVWSYIPPPNNCLVSLDGWYNVEKDQPSSSSGSIPQRLFNAYQHSINSVENGRVPGFAFKHGMPCLQLHEVDLERWSSTENQRQFYREAGIKIAMFMGCKNGEIEIGSSSMETNMDQMRHFFTEDFIRSYSSREPDPLELGRYSTSTPLSLSSGDYPSPFLDMTDPIKEAMSYQVTKPSFVAIPPHQHEMQAHGRSRITPFPTPTSDDAAMTRAMLAVLSSTSSFSSSFQREQTQTVPEHQISDGTGAFKPYIPSLNPMTGTSPGFHGQYMMKLVLAILRSIYSRSRELREAEKKIPHIIAERRRREKMNVGFQELISLLPPLPKKDRVSVLASTMKYLSALKDQLAEVNEKNRMLEAQVSAARERHGEADSQTERVSIQAIQTASPSSSEEREIELRVRVREEDCEIAVLVLCILECLKQMKDVSLISMEADTQVQPTTQWNQVILRLKIKGSAWDDQSIKEAVNRATSDVAR